MTSVLRSDLNFFRCHLKFYLSIFLIMKSFFFSTLSILLLFTSCRKDPSVTQDVIDPLVYNPDWTDATHGNVTPDYTTVFPQDAVNTIEITIGATKWASIRSNMTSIYGADFGSNVGGPPPGPGSTTTEPNYVDVTLKFNNKTWKNVGFRLKGNSTLRSAWASGNYKLPFRLNFDEFEDTYTGVTNQHFYGFEELTFSPGYKDQSLIREKITADIFRMGGIPAPQTAFYRVYVDIGAGLKYWGVYCSVEVPDDNMIKNQLSEESGNTYKPESTLSGFVASQFEKKNNETAADYSDVQQFISNLNSSLRTSNAAQWRTNLESNFNIDHFTKWLAINNAIVNWDTYGAMAHNYYLYNHSTKNLLWIPWDNIEALSKSPGITGTVSGGGPGGMSGLSLSMNEVTSSWPLIRFVADDPVYFQKYKEHLKTFRNTVFIQSEMDFLIDKYYNLISPYAIGANGEQTGYTYLTSSASFTNEKQNLKTHISNRRSLILTYVP